VLRKDLSLECPWCATWGPKRILLQKSPTQIGLFCYEYVDALADHSPRVIAGIWWLKIKMNACYCAKTLCLGLDDVQSEKKEKKSAWCAIAHLQNIWVSTYFFCITWWCAVWCGKGLSVCDIARSLLQKSPLKYIFFLRKRQQCRESATKTGHFCKRGLCNRTLFAKET